jgi:hypothetical protein
MSAFTTIYRAGVMIAAGVIAVQGWQLYGPTTVQIKSMGTRTAEVVSQAWNNMRSGEEERAGTSADPRLTAAPPAAAATAPAEMIEAAPLFAAATTAPAENTEANSWPAQPIASPAADVQEKHGPVAEATDRLPILYSRLEALGVSQPQLAAWGSSGQMYRFCCRAALAEAPAFTRHFEAVATEPAAAVEQVVAKVEAWRTIEGSGPGLP